MTSLQTAIEPTSSAVLRLVPLEAVDSDGFVAAHPKGTIFHTSAMCEALRAPPENDVFAFAAVNECDAVKAILTAVRVATIKGYVSRFASRSVMYAEPIFSDDELGHRGLQMLIQYHDQTMRKNTLFCEVRPQFAEGDERAALEAQAYEYLGYQNYELPLEHDVELLWKQLRSTCRSDIRRSQRRGVTISEALLTDALDEFYSLVQASYEHSNIPLADKSLFRAVADLLPIEQARLTFAEVDGQRIATTCYLIHGDRIVYWFGGVVRTKGIAANSCLLWDAICWSQKQGLRVFDFGGAGWEGKEYGPGKFKAQFGGTLVSHGRYRRIYGKWIFHAAKAAYTIGRKLLAPKVPAAK